MKNREVMSYLRRPRGIARMIFLCTMMAAICPSLLWDIGRCHAEDQDPSTDWHGEVRELFYRLPITVRFSPENPELAENVWAYLATVNGVFNDFDEASELAKLNRLDTGNDVFLSDDLAAAFAKAAEAHKLSEGVFDITCGPLRRLWRNAAKAGKVPAEADIVAAQKTTGFHFLVLEGNKLSLKQAGVKCDFGGIIKGIAADRAITMLKEGGAVSGLVQVGGETVAYGLSPSNRGWRVSIQHPNERDGYWSIIQATAEGFSCSTSGNYEQPLMIDGKEFYHIFDPRTGRPATTQILSASILLPGIGLNSIADSMSTTAIILGPEKTFEIMNEIGGEAMFLIQDGDKIREVQSPGWKEYVK